MTQEVAALVVNFQATDAKLRKTIQRVDRLVKRSSDGMSKKVGDAAEKIGRSTERIGRAQARMSRRNNQMIQQAGFQVGDFAVQVASGQSALRAFIQQGTQLAGAFGPVGAVIGAVGAIVGALATAFLGASEASEDVAEGVSALGDAAGTAEGALDDLEKMMRTYIEAIEAAPAAQKAATDQIVADTEREFNARKKVLALRRAEIAAQVTDTRGTIATIDQQTRTYQVNRGRLIARKGFDFVKEAEAGNVPGVDFSAAMAAQDARLGRRAELDLAAIQAEQLLTKIDTALSQTFGEAATVARRSGRTRTTGSARLERIDLRDVGSPMPPMRPQAMPGMPIPIPRPEGLEEAARAQRDYNDAILAVGDTLAGAVRGADDFRDALRRVGASLIETLAAGAFGQGALGGVVNSALGTEAGGLIGALVNGGAIVNAKGNVFRGGRVQAFAKGGVVSGPTTFPMPSGVGLMGEAGPEAIMPLRRGRDGKLGVAGGGGVNVTASYTINGTGLSADQIGAMLDRREENLARKVAEQGRRGAF